MTCKYKCNYFLHVIVFTLDKYIYIYLYYSYCNFIYISFKTNFMSINNLAFVQLST